MTTITILIQKTLMSGTQALFAPAVGPGAEVRFSSSVSGCEVVFPDNLPFAGGSLSSTPTVRTIPANAVLGIYAFHVVKQGSAEPVAYLQLAVEQGGIDSVGFSVKQEGSAIEVHTEQRVAAGPLTISFEKQVVNEAAEVSVLHNGKAACPTISIPAGSTSAQTTPPTLGGTLSIHLDTSHQHRMAPQETGGTRVIDIIVEPPPGQSGRPRKPPANRPKRSPPRASRV